MIRLHADTERQLQRRIGGSLEPKAAEPLQDSPLAPTKGTNTRALCSAPAATTTAAVCRLGVRRMSALRFGESPPSRRSVDQLRGIEGIRVRTLYKELAKRHGVWRRRDYDPSDFDVSDIPNKVLSAATSCLYGLTEAAVLRRLCAGDRLPAYRRSAISKIWLACGRSRHWRHSGGGDPQVIREEIGATLMGRGSSRR